DQRPFLSVCSCCGPGLLASTGSSPLRSVMVTPSIGLPCSSSTRPWARPRPDHSWAASGAAANRQPMRRVLRYAVRIVLLLLENAEFGRWGPGCGGGSGASATSNLGKADFTPLRRLDRVGKIEW